MSALQLSGHGSNTRKDLRRVCIRTMAPEGMALLAAGRAGSTLTFGTGIVGLLLYAVLSGSGAVVSYALLALAFAFAGVGIGRGFQAGAAGRRFRGARPYARRP